MPLYILVVVSEFKKALNNDLGSIKQNRDSTISVYSSSSFNSSLNIGLWPSYYYYYYYTFFNAATSLLAMADYDFNFNTCNSTSIMRISKGDNFFTIFYFRVLIYFNINCTIGISRPFYPQSDYNIYNIIIYSSTVIRLIYKYKPNYI